MWAWSLNWSEVTPDIVVGTCPMTSDDVRRIHAEAGVSALLSLQHDDCLAYWGIDHREMCSTGQQLGLVMARCPIRDFDVRDMRKHLPRAISTLARVLSLNHRTYVHCTAGLGRAPLVVLGYLILIKNVSLGEANHIVLSGRPGAVPAWEAFNGACDDLETLHRSEIEQRAYGLYQSGLNNDGLADWGQAKSEILRSVLTADSF